MIEIAPFNPIHLEHIELQPEQGHVLELFAHEEYQELLLMGEGYTAFHNGNIVVCAGVFPMTDYMGRAWAFVSGTQGRALLPASRAISDFLKKTDYVRIDTPVRRDFINGHRWCKLLGFINETPERGMKYYGFDRMTYDLYAYFPREQDNGRFKPLQETKD